MVRPVILSLLLHGCLIAQDSLFIEDILELLDTETSQQYDYALFLRELQDQPVYLNHAPLKELLRIPFLSYPQAQAILRYRKQHGRFQNWEELSQLPGFSSAFVQLLRPFMRLTPPKKMWWGSFRFIVGGYPYPKARFPGDWYLGQKWQLGSNNWRLALIAEKDPREPGWLDFLGGTGQISMGNGRIRITGGDFTLSFGQGLLQNSAYGNPASLYYRPIFRRQLIRLQPKVSFNEWAFLRGIAIEYRLARWFSGGAWFSFRSLDARVVGDSIATTVYTSGYHRDSLEWRYRGQLKERLGGIWQRITFAHGGVALLIRRANYSVPVQHRNLMVPVQQYQLSLAGHYQWQHLSWRWESVAQQGQLKAAQSTFWLQLDKWALGMVAYGYSPEFWSLQGRGFGGFSQLAENRKGIYGVVRGALGRRLTLTGYWWWATRLWEYNQATLPIKMRSQLQVRYQRAGGDNFTLRVEYHRPAIYQQNEKPLWQFRLQATLQKIPEVQLQTRLQWKIKAGSKEKGFVAYQSFRILPKPWLRIVSRWTVFSFPENIGGIYQYEPDLTGFIRTVYLRERGYRWLVKIAIKHLPLQVEIKYAVQVTFNTAETGVPQRRRVLRLQLNAFW